MAKFVREPDIQSVSKCKACHKGLTFQLRYADDQEEVVRTIWWCDHCLLLQIEEINHGVERCILTDGTRVSNEDLINATFDLSKVEQALPEVRGFFCLKCQNKLKQVGEIPKEKPVIMAALHCHKCSLHYTATYRQDRPESLLEEL